MGQVINACGLANDEVDSEEEAGALEEPEGEPKGLMSWSTAELGCSPLGLPHNTYGAALVAVMSSGSGGSGGTWDFYVGFYLPVALGLLSALAFQVAITYGLYLTVGSGDDMSCHGGDIFVRLSCLTIFTFSCLTDLTETLDMHRWVQRLPHSSLMQPLQLQKFTKNREVSCRAVTGITTSQKLFFYVCLLLPKLLVVAALFSYGAPYVLHAPDNENLILNSVAMVFVVDIDDIVFGFTMTSDTKAMMDSIPPLSLQEHEVLNTSVFYFEVAWPLTSFVLVGGAVAGMYSTWCEFHQ